MSEVQQLLITYCIDNEAIVHTLQQHIKKTDIFVTLLSCENAAFKEGVLEILEQQEGDVLLLITDNFLKSKRCMYQALNALIRLDTQQRLLPVIAPGITVDPLTKNVITQPAAIEKVSHVIHYMNYWQDYFFELKDQKKNIGTLNAEEYENELKVVRSISAEIGEFLKYLRSIPHFYYEDLAADNFKLLYEVLEKEAFYTPPPDAPPMAQPTHPEETFATSEETSYPTTSPTDEIAAATDTPLLHTREEDAQDPATAHLSDVAEHTEEPIAPEDYPVFMFSAPEATTVSPATTDPSHPSLTPDDEEEEDKTLEEDDIIYYPKKIEALPPMPTHDPDKELQVINEVERLIINGEKDKAQHLLLDALITLPSSANLRYQYAKLLAYANEDFDAAEWQLKLLLSYHPDFPNAYETLGYIAEQNEDYEQALQFYERFAGYDPQQSSEFYYKLGILSQHQPQIVPDKIANYFKIAIKQDPKNADALYQYALIINEQQRDPFKAIDYLKRTLQIRPNHEFANYDLALIYFQLGYKRKAAYYYDKAIQLNPEFKTEENDKAFRIHPEEPIAVPTEKETVSDEPLHTVLAPVEPLPTADHRLTVFITGATSGIGKATAYEFAKAGHRLILAGRSESLLKDIHHHLSTQFGTDVHLLTFDVRYNSQCKAAIESLPPQWQTLDVLVNNAGLAKGLSPIHEGSLEHWDTMIDTNVKGLLYVTRLIAPLMVARRHGHIINIASSAGKETYPNGNVYCATKHAVDALTKTMRLDLYQHNVRVSQVAPGHTEDTNFALTRFDGDSSRARIYEDFTPLSAKDVAEVIYFIATRPAHVNIQDVLLFGTQQAGSNFIDRSGRK